MVPFPLPINSYFNDKYFAFKKAKWFKVKIINFRLSDDYAQYNLKSKGITKKKQINFKEWEGKME